MTESQTLVARAQLCDWITGRTPAKLSPTKLEEVQVALLAGKAIKLTTFPTHGIKILKLKPAQ